MSKMVRLFKAAITQGRMVPAQVVMGVLIVGGTATLIAIVATRAAGHGYATNLLLYSRRFIHNFVFRPV